MGTNYYMHVTGKKALEFGSSVVHIGKSSFGWEFNFQGYRPGNNGDEATGSITSWADWKAVLSESGSICQNEDGKKVTLKEFINLVEVDKAPGVFFKPEKGLVLLNHIDEILRDTQYQDVWDEYRDVTRCWKDAQGYAFTTTRFS